MADPMLSMKVGTKQLPFLVDTGATCSTLMNTPPNTLSDETITVVGFSGEKQTLPITVPIVTQLGGQKVTHSYVHSPTVPLDLLLRDLLIKLGASILCSPDGLRVTLPDGTELQCDGVATSGQYLMQPIEETYADIYWGMLQPETVETPGILSAYLQWKPWIAQIEPYVSPPDPPHVTLFYDRLQTDWYLDKFQDQLEGNSWEIKTQNELCLCGSGGCGSRCRLDS